jgi:dihydroorotate dehydrogenase (fumarate)
MTTLSSKYLGIPLSHPIIAAASPLTSTFDGMRRLEDAGAAAVVMSSLYEEQVRAEDTNYTAHTDYTAGCHPEASTYFPELPDYQHGVSGYLDTLRRAAVALKIPVIASLNGTTDDGWLDFAVMLEQAGAAALELNLYILPTDFAMSSAQTEQRYIDILRHVKSEVKIPVTVKLPAFFSAFGHFVSQLESAGAAGVVLFNHFFRSDVDLDTLTFQGNVAPSTPKDIHLPLTWIALLSERVKLSLAAGMGVESHIEVVKYLLAGADVVATASSLLRHGVEHMTTLVLGLERWLGDGGYASVSAIRGKLDGTHVERADIHMRSQYTHSLADAWKPFSPTVRAGPVRPTNGSAAPAGPVVGPH